MHAIIRLRQRLSLRQTARETDVCKDTVIKYAVGHLLKKKDPPQPPAEPPQA